MYDEYGNWIEDDSFDWGYTDTGTGTSTDTTDWDALFANTDWGDGDTTFEEDWNDVTGGLYTMDEIGSNIDVQDLYTASQSDPSILSTIGNFLKNAGSGALNMVKKAYTKDDGSIDWGNVAATAGGLYGLYQSQKPQEKTGYQVPIPRYTATRQAVENTYDPNRRPGSGGQRYFSQMEYTPEGGDVAAAETRAAEEVAGLKALNAANPARQERPTKAAVEAGAESADVNEGRAASAVIEDLPVPTEYAKGGITTLQAKKDPRYLSGQTDGMADKIAANIDGKQEAALSHGEFVIPADVVSHLGNGNSDAGAERLYAMMDKIRQARTGTKKQGKRIDPNKFLPA